MAPTGESMMRVLGQLLDGADTDAVVTALLECPPEVRAVALQLGARRWGALTGPPDVEIPLGTAGDGLFAQLEPDAWEQGQAAVARLGRQLALVRRQLRLQETSLALAQASQALGGSDDPLPVVVGVVGTMLGASGVEVSVELLVRGQVQREVLVAAHPPDGAPTLQVPLRVGDQVAGRLQVWRAQPFDLPLDQQVLSQFGPEVATACARRLQLRTQAREATVSAALVGELQPTTRLHEAAQQVAAHLMDLGEAAACALLWYAPDDPGRLLIGASVGLSPAAGDALLEALPAPKVSVAGLVARPPISFPDQRGQAILLDHSGSCGAAQIVFGQEAADHAVRAFLPYAIAMLHNHTHAHIRALVDQVSVEQRRPEAVITAGAQILKAALGADAVLVFSNDSRGLALAHSAPTVELPLRLRSRNPGATPLDASQLRALAGALGVDTVQVALCLSVPDGERSEPHAWLVLHVPGRSALFAPHIELATAVAQRAHTEAARLGRRVMLEELRDLSAQFSQLSGIALGKAMVEGLESWFDQWLRPGCGVYIHGHLGPDQDLVAAVSERVRPEHVEPLRLLSSQLGHRSRRWSASTYLKFDSKVLPLGVSGMALPLGIWDDSPVAGHLFLLSNADFHAIDQELCEPASREVAVHLGVEHRRVQSTLEAGLFRHALLGPVQGLADAAIGLVRQLEKDPIPMDRVRQLRGIIQMEVESIRTWQHSQQLMTPGTTTWLDVRPTEQSLRAVVDRCMDRYRPILADRNIQLRLDWPGGAITFPFDADALDLALSNLLHNATKYTYYNRDVTVGASVGQDKIVLWVEDIGHPIPRDVEEDLYKPGRRFVGRDPLRAIPGEGLGLYIVRSVVEAHGGQIRHRCTPETTRDAGDRTPYRVRFTLELPHHWKKRSL